MNMRPPSGFFESLKQREAGLKQETQAQTPLDIRSGEDEPNMAFEGEDFPVGQESEAAAENVWKLTNSYNYLTFSE